MNSKDIVLYARNRPMSGVDNPGPHQRYQDPTLKIEQKKLIGLNPEMIRVRMLYAGICGTDIHLTEKDPETGYIKSSAPASIPDQGRIIGHEGVGQILETGGNVQFLEPGMFVTFESIIICNFCDMCRKGRFNQCRRAKLLGLEQDGIFGEIVDVPASLAHDVSEMVGSKQDLISMACVEPAGVAHVACQNARISAGDKIIIFGAGPIGVLSCVLAKNVFGASEVHVVEPIEFRRKMASSWADQTYPDKKDLPADFDSLDVLIEASGSLDNVTDLFTHMGPNSRIVLLARSGEPLNIKNVDHMISKAITIIGSRGHLCGAFNNIFSLYKNNRLPLGEIVSTKVQGISGLYDLLCRPEKILNDNCKVLAEINSPPDLGD